MAVKFWNMGASAARFRAQAQAQKLKLMSRPVRATSGHPQAHKRKLGGASRKQQAP